MPILIRTILESNATHDKISTKLPTKLFRSVIRTFLSPSNGITSNGNSVYISIGSCKIVVYFVAQIAGTLLKWYFVTFYYSFLLDLHHGMAFCTLKNGAPFNHSPDTWSQFNIAGNMFDRRVGTNEFSVSLYYKYLLSTHKKLSIKW